MRLEGSFNVSPTTVFFSVLMMTHNYISNHVKNHKMWQIHRILMFTTFTALFI